MQYRFDEFVVDTAQFALMRQGDPQHAEPQVIELILYLLKNRGRMWRRCSAAPSHCTPMHWMRR